MSFWSRFQKKSSTEQPSKKIEPEPQELYYRADDLQRLAVYQEERRMALLQRRLSRVASLSIEDAEVLGRCTTFATLEEHRERLTRELGLDDDNSLREQLQSLIAAGVLCEEREFFSDEAPASPPAINTLATITRDRASLLSRCMSSYLQNAAKYERALQVVVCDDSVQPEMQHKNQEALAEVKNKYKNKITYIGLAQKLAFCQELERQGLSRDSIQFAVLDAERTSYTPGANRNAVLLATIGSAIFSVDDDTVCSVYQPKEAESSLVFSSEQDPLDAYFFASREEALQAFPEIEIDPIAAHEKLLGSSICKKMSIDFAKNPLEKASSVFSHKISKYGGAVAITANGMLGDSGMGSPAWFLYGLNKSSRNRLLPKEATYQNAFRSRELSRISLNYKITDSLYCMGMFLGMDNRSILPPFFPAFRNEDGVFALTLRALSDRFYLGHVPIVMQHQPQAGRAYDSQNIFSINLLFSDIVFYCISHAVSLFSWRSAPTISSNMMPLGKNLIELGSLPQQEWIEFLTISASKSRSQLYDTIQNEIKNNKDKSGFLYRNLISMSGNVFNNITSDNLTIPVDLLNYVKREEVHSFSQRLILKYGELLTNWESIIDATKHLKTKGVELGRAI